MVLNKYARKKWELKPKYIQNFLETPIKAIIPEDDNVKKAIAKRIPVVESYPNSPAAKAFIRFAEKLLGMKRVRVKKESAITKILKFLGLK